MEFTPITLDSVGLYIQGPDIGKADYLLEIHGAERLRPPTKFSTPEGTQMICIIDNDDHDTALWVQDDDDFKRCRRMQDADPSAVQWLVIGSEPLYTAERESPHPTVDPGVNGRIVQSTRISDMINQ